MSEFSQVYRHQSIRRMSLPDIRGRCGSVLLDDFRCHCNTMSSEHQSMKTNRLVSARLTPVGTPHNRLISPRAQSVPDHTSSL